VQQKHRPHLCQPLQPWSRVVGVVRQAVKNCIWRYQLSVNKYSPVKSYPAVKPGVKMKIRQTMIIIKWGQYLNFPFDHPPASGVPFHRALCRLSKQSENHCLLVGASSSWQEARLRNLLFWKCCDWPPCYYYHYTTTCDSRDRCISTLSIRFVTYLVLRSQPRSNIFSMNNYHHQDNRTSDLPLGKGPGLLCCTSTWRQSRGATRSHADRRGATYSCVWHHAESIGTA